MRRQSHARKTMSTKSLLTNGKENLTERQGNLELDGEIFPSTREVKTFISTTSYIREKCGDVVLREKCATLYQQNFLMSKRKNSSSKNNLSKTHMFPTYTSERERERERFLLPLIWKTYHKF